MPILKPARRAGGKYLNPVDTSVGGLKIVGKALGQYLTNKEERSPRAKLGPFQTDASVYQQTPQTGLRVTWMGHSSLLVEIDSQRVLIDPIWDQRASPVSWAGPKRFFEPPLALDQLPPVDVVLISHNHYDHLGKQSVQLLNRLKTRWVTSMGVAQQLAKFGVNAQTITELDWTESIKVGELSITALPARHFSGRAMWDHFETLWSSFVLRGDHHNVYYGADSGSWDGFAEIAHRYGPFDLTMLEIGAYNDLWKDIHMGPDGAAKAFLEMGASGLLMPIHWGLFDLAMHAWRQPIQRLIELADQHKFKLWTPEPGAPTDVVAGHELRSTWYV